MIGALAIALILAPSVNGGARAASADKAKATKVVTLTYELWDQDQIPAMRQIIGQFQRSHPNVRVKLHRTLFTVYWTKLQSAAAGGTLADIFWMNGPHFPLYASNGILMPLSSLASRDHLSLGHYPRSLVKLYSFKNQLYALPKDYDTIGLWYNKTLFRAAGLSYPNSSWTWNTLQDAARRLTNPSKGVFGIAAPATNQEGYYNTIFQNGGYVISPNRKKSGYDNPKTIGGLKFWYSFVKNKWSPSQAQLTPTASRDTDTWLEEGKVAMVFGGSWLALRFATNAYTRDKVDVAILPKGAQRATVIHGLGYAVNRRTKHPKEAWELLKFLASSTAALVEARTGTVIPAYKGTQSAWAHSVPQFHLQYLLDEVRYAKPFPVSERSADWELLEDRYFTEAWDGQLGMDDAARTVARQMNGILATER